MAIHYADIGIFVVQGRVVADPSFSIASPIIIFVISPSCPAETG
jgi:hypothetical protein